MDDDFQNPFPLPYLWQIQDNISANGTQTPQTQNIGVIKTNSSIILKNLYLSEQSKRNNSMNLIQLVREYAKMNIEYKQQRKNKKKTKSKQATKDKLTIKLLYDIIIIS